MEATELWYFLGFQVMALVIIFLCAGGWGIKRGEDITIIPEAYPPFIVGAYIYCTALIVGGVLAFFEIIHPGNRWFLYVGLSLCSGALSGLAPNIDTWEQRWKRR